MNILELFSKLKQMDEELIEFTPQDHADILNDTQSKIDAYHAVYKRMGNDIIAIRLEMDELKEKKGRIEKSLDRLENYLIESCKQHDITEFKGHKSKLQLIKRALHRAKFPPSEEHYQRYSEFMDKRVDTSYSWKRDEIISAFENSDPKAAEVFEKYDSKYVRFK